MTDPGHGTLKKSQMELLLPPPRSIVAGGASFHLFFPSWRGTNRGYHYRELIAEYSYEGGLPLRGWQGWVTAALMPKRLKRYYGHKDLHFLTFCCYHRHPYLQTVRAKNLFLKVLREVRAQFQFSLVGYVLMPDHVHLLLSEPEKGTVSKVLQVLKQRVSRVMRGRKRRACHQQMALNFGDALPQDRRFWQRRFYDFNVWSHAKKKEKLHYMHANPVKERLVQHPQDWPWSSFSFYANDEPGLIHIDPVD